MISWFRRAGPFANHDLQLVSLLLQLAHPLDLHRQVATKFRDLAFDGIWQRSASGRLSFPTRAT